VLHMDAHASSLPHLTLLAHVRHSSERMNPRLEAKFERAEIVTAAISRKCGNIRRLARQIAGEDGGVREIEKWRRTLYRLKDGATVEPESAELIAKVLDIDPNIITRRAGEETVGARQQHLERELAEIRSEVAGVRVVLARIVQKLDL
jgi:hypothetical protein